MRKGFFHRMRNMESLGENLWCFMAGFLLAELCVRDGVKLIHSPWANGPATASWVASRLTGIPFAFTGRAGDIYPEDGLLREKSADALFIRTNNHANVSWLRKFCPAGQEYKVHAIYNSLTFTPKGQCAVSMPASTAVVSETIMPRSSRPAFLKLAAAAPALKPFGRSSCITYSITSLTVP